MNLLNESDGGFLHGGEMRHAFEFDRGPQAVAVFQDMRDAARVGFEELLEHPAGEELVLAEFLWAEAMAGGVRCVLRRRVGRLQPEFR